MNFEILVELHGDLAQRMARMEALLSQQSQQGVRIMATLEQLAKDVANIRAETGAYIAARDAADVDLKQQLSDALAAGQLNQATLDAAFADAEAVVQALAPPGAPQAQGNTTPPAVG